jgi:hypothetical protein
MTIVRLPGRKLLLHSPIAASPDLVREVKALGAVVYLVAQEAGWQDVVDQALFGGFPLANEVVFFHRPSATLIATDLAFNVRARSPLLTRLAFRRSLERVLEWPFERIVVAHGEISEHAGREELIRGYSWLLGEARAV